MSNVADVVIIGGGVNGCAAAYYLAKRLNIGAVQENAKEDIGMSRISKIEVITGMSKLTDLIQQLSKVGIRGVTVMQVLGCGVEMGTQEYEVDINEVMELLPKQQINIVVETSKVDKILDIIKKELYTGHIGDGKIFVYSIDNVIRVRTGDEGLEAL